MNYIIFLLILLCALCGQVLDTVINIFIYLYFLFVLGVIFPLKGMPRLIS